MLQELSKYNKFLSKEAIYQLVKTISHSKNFIYDNNMCKFLNCSDESLRGSFKLLTFAKIISDKEIKVLLSKESYSNEDIINYIIKGFFEKLSNIDNQDFINVKDIKYSEKFSYHIQSSAIKLKYSGLRNALINYEFFKISNDGKFLIFNEKYLDAVKLMIKNSKRKYTLEDLKKKLILQEEYGELAEKFVLEYEQKRLSKDKAKLVKRISEIDVMAGYDICSFNDDSSNTYNRYIEVKSFSKNVRFYWSKNEVEVARKYGDKYYLYLVDRDKISCSEYKPEIVCNPIDILKSDDYIVEVDSYVVKKYNY
ncbi:Uncharacterised protein [Clostridium paraputrificum]|nr:Uncharacterised protein [Clostridium paraputrificum]